MVAERNQLHINFMKNTSIHSASSLYRFEAFQSHVATKKNGVPALYKFQLRLPITKCRKT